MDNCKAVSMANANRCVLRGDQVSTCVHCTMAAYDNIFVGVRVHTCQLLSKLAMLRQDSIRPCRAHCTFNVYMHA